MVRVPRLGLCLEEPSAVAVPGPGSSVPRHARHIAAASDQQ